MIAKTRKYEIPTLTSGLFRPGKGVTQEPATFKQKGSGLFGPLPSYSINTVQPERAGDRLSRPCGHTAFETAPSSHPDTHSRTTNCAFHSGHASNHTVRPHLVHEKQPICALRCEPS